MKQMQEVANEDNVSAIISLEEEINFLLEQEDLRWRQCAKRDCYRLGDKNTKIFHTHATQRKKKNKIISIQNKNGNTVEEK